MIVYRGVLAKPIVFPESVIITPENLDSIDFDKVIYFEISPKGAMGNDGGILIYLLKDEDNLITYETNVSLDKQSYDAALNIADQKINLFIGYGGGFGNYVYIKKNVQLEVDKKYKCFWYHSQNTKLRINSSVEGVFLSVVADMESRNTGKNHTVLVPNFQLKNIKNPWGGEDRVKLEVEKAIRNRSKTPKPFNCRKCGELFQPAPFQWIYYELCDKCFKVFDTQKMLGRTATLNNMNKKKGYVHHFEDVTEWIMHGDD